MVKYYEIVVEDHLNPEWSDCFDGMRLEQKCMGAGQVAVTIISGVVKDQAALYGLLIKARDLGLTLISVSQIDVMKEIEQE